MVEKVYDLLVNNALKKDLIDIDLAMNFVIHLTNENYKVKFNNIDYDQILINFFLKYKNKNINFDEEFFNLILLISKKYRYLKYNIENSKFINKKYDKIYLDDFNNTLVFLSTDYTNLLFMDDADLQMLYNVISNNIIDFMNIFRDKNYMSILRQIEKYNKVIYKILYDNKDLIIDQNKKRDEFYQYAIKKYKNIFDVEDSKLFFERKTFILITCTFICNIKTFNYDYKLITEVFNMIDINLYTDKYVRGNFNLEEYKDMIYTIMKEKTNNLDNEFVLRKKGGFFCH